MKDFKGRVAVVTGGASGIGFAMCARFAAEGMRIVMADLEDSALLEASERLRKSGAEVLAVPTDVSDWEAVQNLAAEVTARFEGANILCNNAGVRSMGPIWKTTIEDWRWVMGVNFWGVVHGIKAFLPAMIERGQPGHIINTASVTGLLAFKHSAPYSSSKSAVISLTESLHQELQHEGAAIGVSVLCPGTVPTNFRETSDRLRPSGEKVEARKRDPLVHPQTANDVAERVLESIRADRFWILTHPQYAEVIERRCRGIVQSDEVVPGIAL